MKTLQEFEQFLASDDALQTDLTALEKQRKSVKSSTIIISIIVFAFVGAMGYFFYQKTKMDYQLPQTQVEQSENSSGNEILDDVRRQAAQAQEAVQESDRNNNIILMIAIFVGGGFVLSYFYAAFMKRKVRNNAAVLGGGSGDFNFDFKDKIIRKIIAFWDPNFRYQINNHVKLEEVLESGMIRPKNYKTEGSDMIRGEIDGVAFKFSDLQMWKEKTFVEKGEDPYDNVLFGSFFMADFRKEFKSPVYIYPNKSFLSSSIDELYYEGEKVLLEDPEFTRKFEVYSLDQIEARCILTTSMMERIKNMSQKMEYNLHFVFANNKVYILNNNNKDRFESSWFKKMDKKETLIAFYNELAEQLSIIDELKLNRNIWK